MATRIQFNEIEKPEIEYYPKSFAPIKSTKTGNTQLLDAEVFYTLHKEYIEKGLGRNPAIDEKTYKLCEDCYYMHTEDGMTFREIQDTIQKQYIYA